MHQSANNLMLTYYYLVPSIIGWVMGMASGLQKPLSIISRFSFGTSEEKKLEQRCFPNINHAHAAKIDLDLQTRPSDEAKGLLCEYVANQFSDSQGICRKPRFLSMVTLTFDLDIQTRPNEGPNTSSLWIWRKSVHRFPRCFIHKKSHSVKNRTLGSSLHAIINRPTG